MTHGSLCTGIGGFDLGAEAEGIETIWSCEIEEFPRKVLRKHFKNTRQYGDIKGIGKLKWVNIISAGFPCQDISIAGEGQGIEGERSSLWKHVWRITRVNRPDYLVLENSAALTSRGLGTILTDLAQIGYDAEWQCLHATSFGLQHGRERIFIIAYPHKKLLQGSQFEPVFWIEGLPRQSARISPGWKERSDIPEPRGFRSVDEFSDLVDRNKCLGNAVCPDITQYLFKCIKRHYKQK